MEFWSFEAEDPKISIPEGKNEPITASFITILYSSAVLGPGEPGQARPGQDHGKMTAFWWLWPGGPAWGSATVYREGMYGF
jgi:hypothetical protein